MELGTRDGRLRACVVALTPDHSTEPALRSAAFSVTSAVEGLGLDDGDAPLPYRAVWARTGGRREDSELVGHTDDVNAMSQLVVDGHPVLATASRDHTVRLWDLETVHLDRTLTGHTGSVDALCPLWLAGRQVLASGGEDRTIRLWEPATGEPLLSIVDNARVRALCAVPVDGRELLAAAGERGVRLWDPADGRIVRELTGLTGWVTGLFQSEVDRQPLLVSLGTDGTVRLSDPATGEPGRVLRRGAPGTTAACVLPSPPRLALAGPAGAVQVWDLASGTVTHTLQDPDGDPTIVALGALRMDGRSWVVSARNSETLRLWDPDSGRSVWVSDGGRGEPVSALGQAGTLLAVGYAGSDPANFAPGSGTIQLWDPDTGGTARVLESHRGRVLGLGSVAVGGSTLLASAGADHTIRLWDAGTGALRRTLAGHVHWVNAACAVPTGDATLLASASHDRTVRLWDPDTGACVRVLSGHTNAVTALCPVWTTDRWLLASTGYDGTVRLWDPGSGATRRILEPKASSLYAVCSGPVDAEPLLACAGDDGVVRLWDPPSGRLVRVLAGHTSRILGLAAVAVEGRPLLASASHDRTVRLWDPATGDCEAVLSGHTDEVRAVGSGSDGWLASAGADATVRLWEVPSGAQRFTIPVRSPANACVSVGSTLAIGLDQGVLAVHVARVTGA